MADDDLLSIPDFMKRQPPARPAAAIATTPTERTWIMPKSAKAKPAKSQKTDPAAIAAKKAARAAAKPAKAPRAAAAPKAQGERKRKAGDGATGAREGSKLAKVVEMLRRPEGATIEQIVKATEWQRHSVRGAIAGAIKKKLGLAVTTEKPEGGDRVYRIG